ncbi:hypothetical protein ACIQAL_26540, partial [Pseudomonas sp. NPDC088368]|uniref:hypothetical protein n=1 Tax=Pseudomonas sp. NPDC088368 TaxID=3364453 RepID=UPI0038059052
CEAAVKPENSIHLTHRVDGFCHRFAMDRRQANSYGLRPESKANANTNAKLHCDPLLPKAWELACLRSAAKRQ